MICTSIQHKTYEQILSILDDPFVEMAEIRLDLCNLSESEIGELFGECEKPLIACCRPSAGMTPKRREQLLETAVKAGARYVDLEVDAPAELSKKFRRLCADNDTEFIRSYHNGTETPDTSYLVQVALRCLRYGADIVKIVTAATCKEDVKRVEAIYSAKLESGEELPYEKIVAFALNAAAPGSAAAKFAENSRINCLKNGAPFTYAALEAGEETAPGQLPLDEMHARVYGNVPSFFRDFESVPASKSFAQRAIIAAALATGTSHLHGYTPCEDSESAIKVAKALGAKVHKSSGDGPVTLTIQGIGPISGPLPISSLNTGESGLLTRLMIPIAAAICEGDVTISGEKTLLERPLTGAADIMAAFGVTLESKSRDIRVPLTVHGPLLPGTADIPGQGGSQLISGLLMALPLCSKPSRLYVDEPRSIPYMFITMDVLRRFGVRITNEMEGDAEALEQQDWSSCLGINFNIRGGQQLRAADFDIEGDWSAAANFLVAGAIWGSTQICGLDTHSLQADISILDVLVEAGAAVSYEDGDTPEESLVSVRKAPLEAFQYDLSNAPDLFPISAVLASYCPGVSALAGVNRLHAKETDRAAAIIEMLDGFGVAAKIEGDVMYIEGESAASRVLNGRLLRGGSFSSHHDHRMAMALRIASYGSAAPVEIDDISCVAKSFPEFFELLD